MLDLAAHAASEVAMTERAESLLDTVAELVAENDDLEHLARPLLDLLESVTGLDSTYLTTIDREHNIQRVLYANNTRDLAIPEGLEVVWADTLCKRALDEGRSFTDDVVESWGDSDAARALGISTYLSAPIYIADGELYGTLCGASGRSVDIDERARRVLSLFAHMIARQVERERLIERLQRENRLYQQEAMADPLTGIPNRRALHQELSRALAMSARSDCAVYVALIDLDGFKQVNDIYGHDAGDRLLIEIAKRLLAGMRESDYVARYGGDEFVVYGLEFSHEVERACEAFGQRLHALTAGEFCVGDAVLNYPGASVGVVRAEGGRESVDDVIRCADAAMYRHKIARQSER